MDFSSKYRRTESWVPVLSIATKNLYSFPAYGVLEQSHIAMSETCKAYVGSTHQKASHVVLGEETTQLSSY